MVAPRGCAAGARTEDDGNLPATFPGGRAGPGRSPPPPEITKERVIDAKCERARRLVARPGARCARRTASLARVVSRSEGYLRGAGKEALALASVQEFFRLVVGVPLDVITDAQENYRLGDLRSAAGVYMECKGQPIDPQRYPQNFVEVFEQTHNPEHANGFDEVAELLDLTPEALSNVVVTLRDRSRVRLGRLPSVGVSIHSFFSAPLTTYVNYEEGGRWIYVYDRQELTNHIKEAVPRGLRRGVGNSNEDTFSVFVPIAARRWQRVRGGWQWAGTGPAEASVAHLRAALNGGISAL
jgi:hypothetical protein